VAHVAFPWDEYGVCIRNIKRGIMPPLSGSVDNFFTRGMGAAIRSELWAAWPLRPVLAADTPTRTPAPTTRRGHLGGGLPRGLEAAAFGGGSIRNCIDAAACVLPTTASSAAPIRDTINWWDAIGDLMAVRSKILASMEATTSRTSCRTSPS
jgi:hypothetical protein